jgi:hypothetical protein
VVVAEEFAGVIPLLAVRLRRVQPVCRLEDPGVLLLRDTQLV